MSEVLNRCFKCGNEKLRINFHKNKTRNDGLNPNCKVCRKKYFNENLAKIKKFYLDNRDKKKEYRKKYYTEIYEIEKNIL